MNRLKIHLRSDLFKFVEEGRKTEGGRKGRKEGRERDENRVWKGGRQGGRQGGNSVNLFQLTVLAAPARPVVILPSPL